MYIRRDLIGFCVFLLLLFDGLDNFDYGKSQNHNQAENSAAYNHIRKIAALGIIVQFAQIG